MVRQRENFIALMTNYNQVLKAQTIETNSAGLATERYDIYLQNLEASANKFKAAWQGVWQETINPKAIKFFYDIGTAFAKAIKTGGGLIPILTQIGGLLLIIKAQSIGAALVQQYLNFGVALKSISSVLAIIKENLTGSRGIGGIATSMATSLTSWIGLLITVAGIVASIISSIPTLSERIEKANQKIEELSGAISTLRSNKSSIQELWSEFETLYSKTYKTTEEQERLRDVQNEIKDIVPQVNGYYDEQGNFLVDINTPLATYVDLIERELKVKQALLTAEASSRLEDEAKQYEKVSKEIQRKEDYLNRLLKIQSSMTLGSSVDLYTATRDPDKIALDIAELRADVEAKKQQIIADYFAVGDAQKAVLMSTLKDMGIFGKEIIDEIAKMTGKGVGYLRGFQEEFGHIGELEEIELKTLAEKSEELDDITKDATSSAISSYGALKDALEDYAETGSLTVDQSQALADAGYAEALSFDASTGAITINYWMLRSLAIAKADAAIAALEDQLRIWEETKAIEAQELAIKNNIALWQQRRNAIAGTTDTTSLLKALGVATRAASSATSKLKDETEELAKAQKQAYQDEIKGIEKQKDALEDQIDALEAQKDAYKEIIEAKKEKLKLDKEEAEYKDEVEDKNKEIAEIDRKLYAIQFDNSEEAVAQRLELEEEKAEKLEDLAEYQADRTYDIQIDALDAEYEAFAKLIDMQIAGIEAVISKFDDMIDAINEAIDALGRLADAQKNAGTTAKTTSGTTTTKATSTKTSWFSSQLQRTAEQAQGVVKHDGGVVGDSTNLKEAEIYAKLLKGEVVANDTQMKGFINDTLPQLVANYGGTAGIGDVKLIMNVAGNLDSTVVPDIEKLVNKAVDKINNTLTRRGYTKTANQTIG